MFKKHIYISLLCLAPFVTQANLFIDYQGEKASKKTAKQLRDASGVPDGYHLYTDRYRGIIHEVGTGKPNKINTFGNEMDMKVALTMIVPDEWVVYAEEQFTKIPLVSWDAKDEPWLATLAKMGGNFGIKYIVDWDQKVVQISQDLDFVVPDFNQPVILDVPKTDKQLFIYTNESKRENKGGFILIDGKLVPIKVKALD